MLRCSCCIVPKDVLERFAGDKKLTQEVRKAAADSARLTGALHNLRSQAGELTSISRSIGAHLDELAAGS